MDSPSGVGLTSAVGWLETSLVTKFASGVAVAVGKGVTVGNTISGTTVSVSTGDGVGVSGIHPTGVGVWYCPHNDALPTQDVKNSDAVTSK